MKGNVIQKISDKMQGYVRATKRGLMSATEAISSLSGYLDALQDMKMITACDHSAKMGEFTKMILN